MTVNVIGAGLAGVEASYYLASKGFSVNLYEMKPKKHSPAHKKDSFAELVCSNSLKSDSISTAGGMLKAELRLLNSLVISAAEKTKVPAGGALAVDRDRFSDTITEIIENQKNIKIIYEEVENFPLENTIICTGPLTSDPLAEKIAEVCGNSLSFYDAAAPIVTAESIDMSRAFFAARYDKGGADYINCPMEKDEYLTFYNELVSAESVPLKAFENLKVYEGCMPVEVLAKRGIESVRYGCMKPVGLTDPKTGKRPYACVQLRKENSDGTLYNLVGFQTNLKFPEQRRVFGLIPALKNAEFMRYGVMHRNTFLNSPELLDENFYLKNSKNIFFGGQITGVEGYVESAMSGLIAGISLANRLLEKPPISFPQTTMIGALCKYICNENADFQPMGANMGVLPPLPSRIKCKQERYEAISKRGINDMKNYLQEVNI